MKKSALKILKIICVFYYLNWKIYNFASATESEINENNVPYICKIIELSEFILPDYCIENIPKDILNGEEPTILILNNKNLNHVTLEVKLLKNLILVDFSENSLTELCEMPASIKSILCSKNRLTSIPEHFCNLINLETLEMSSNNFNVFPKSIRYFTKLKNLDLSQNKIADIHDIMSNLADIETIHLEYNEITNLPNSIANLTSLKYLNLSFNNLVSFSDNCENLINLVELNLSHNSIKSIQALCKIKSLKKLLLSFNHIDKIPNEICEMENLEHIELSNNNIYSVPKKIEKCKKLSFFNLSNNYISCIKTICLLENLENLNLLNNEILIVPSDIGNLKKLIFLNLSENCIQNLPNEFTKCSKLEILSLSDNQIENIEIVCQIYSLEELYLSINHISNIPEIIGNLKNLLVLDLSKNNFPKIPKDLEKCKKLYRLLLSNNLLQNLDSVCNLSSLEILFVNENEISYISENICILENLIVLNLSGNNIKVIPEEIIKCKKLKKLYMQNNKITQLSDKLFEPFIKLQFFDLRNNPIIYPENSSCINIFEIKHRMSAKLSININDLKKIKCIFDRLIEKPVYFNFVNLRKCRSSILPETIYSEQDLLLKINNYKEKFNCFNKKTGLDNNKFKTADKPCNTTSLINFIHHLYNPEEIFLGWNVPDTLINDFKKYLGAIILKIFSSDDNLYIEGHLNSLLTALCYCPERQKAELLFLYELLNNDIGNLYTQEAKGSFETNKIYIEEMIKKFIGKAKLNILMHLFLNPAHDQNVILYNTWVYLLKDHVGVDFFEDDLKSADLKEFDGKIEQGLKAYYDILTPEWLLKEMEIYINGENYLICKIAEYLYYANIQNKHKFVVCENGDILLTKRITIDFCEFILKSLEIITNN